MMVAAAAQNDRAGLEHLLAADVDVNAPIMDLAESEDITPLLIATCWGWKDIVRALCIRGADINKVMQLGGNFACWNGWTVLHVAVALNHKDVAEELMKYGADSLAKINNGTNLNGHNSFDLAKMRNSQEMIQLLERYKSIKPIAKDQPIDFNEPPLITAIRKWDIEGVVTLLGDKADPNIIITTSGEYKNFSALCFAAYLGCAQIIELLLKNGASIDYIVPQKNQCWDGFSPLHIAIARHNIEAVDMLLRHRANPDKPTASTKTPKETPLWLATALGYVDIMQQLFAAKGQANYTATGLTPLHLAIMNKHLEAVKELLAHGADINYPVQDPKHPLHNFSPLCIAVSDSSQEGLTFLSMLIQAGANLNHAIANPKKQFDGQTPLSLAMEIENWKAAYLLAKAGAGIDNLVNGFTPLQIAIIRKHFDIAQELVHHKTNLNVPVQDAKHVFHNFTPLCLASIDPSPEGQALTSLLVQAGAAIEYKIDDPKGQFNGYSPLLLAIEKENWQQRML